MRRMRFPGAVKRSARSSYAPYLAWPLLAATPLLLFGAHLMFGANQTLAALWFTAILGLGLCAALIFPAARRDLAALNLAGPAFLFAALLAVAAATLLPSLTGGFSPVRDALGAPGPSSVNRSATLIEGLKLMGLACVFLVGCIQGARAERARMSMDALLIMGAAYAGLGLIGFVSGGDPLQDTRLSAGFLSANTAATVFGLLTILGLGGVVRRWRRTHGVSLEGRLFALTTPLCLTLLSLACLILTASRMGAMATALAAAILIIWELAAVRARTGALILAGLVATGAVLAVVMGGNDLLLDRLDRVEADAATRTTIFSAHWEAFRQAPWFGYGLGSFTDLNSHIMDPETYRSLWNLRALHNVYLQWLVEGGIVGAAPMFALIALIGATGWRRARQAHAGRTTVRALVCANVVVLAHGLTDYALQVPSVAAFWAFLLGLQYAWAQAPEPRHRQAASEAGRAGA